VRQALGLTEVKLFGSSAAPLRRDVLDFFISLNIPIYDGYGMSEATGPVLFNSQGSWKAGTSGIPIAGIEIKLHEQDGNGEGELCYRGRNVMMGYHRKQDTTLESLDSEGWFRSGDLAVVDKDGFYTITGRRKGLL
jgi:long-chain-fatty-acid--CoA ligase ACSBG